MIRKKLQVMMMITFAAAVVMAIVANWSLRSVESASEKNGNLALFIRHHMESDMMHEAIYLDVLKALREGSRYNNSGVKAAAEDLGSHTKNMSEALAENQKLPVAPELRAAVDHAMPLLVRYREEAERVMRAATTDPLAAERALISFGEEYENLEAKLAKISDMAEADIAASDRVIENLVERVNLMILVATGVMLVFMALIGYKTFAQLLNPLRDIIQQMMQLAQGNLDMDIRGADRKDEVGSMSRAMQVFKDNAMKTKELEAERLEGEQRAQEEKKQAMHEMAHRFEQRVQGIISSVAAASTQLLQTAQGMSSVMEEANTKAASVARAAEATTGNVQTVASAAEEMTASVKEISSQVSKSTHVVADTVSKAEHADSNAKELEGAAQQIGHVVQLIQDIAEQINLLALNATIESARAGDAGKGFAVVASEVKNLATQTTKATEEIASQIEGIQIISKSVVEALNAIKGSIDHVSEYAGGIASAVEEQSAVTDEIAANMQTAASGTNDIRVNINEVTTSATNAKDSANTVLEASRSLSVEAETLSREVADFLAEIRG